jgi:transposase
MDNCATHCFVGGEILGECLDEIGCILVYLPTYSPELNPIELVFNKLKTILHRVDYQDLLRDNQHVAAYEALKQITASDMRGFYKHVDYINLR